MQPDEIQRASAAAERLTAALGTPLPALRPAVTSRQIGDLARAGFLDRVLALTERACPRALDGFTDAIVAYRTYLELS